MIGAILSVVVACGFFFYTEREKKRFASSLPQPPVIEKNVDVHTHPHPHEHSHEHPTPATGANTGAFESETILIENSVSTEPMAKDEPEGDTVRVAEEEPAGETWQTDETPEHQSTRSPFAQKYPDPRQMDPDEFADILMKGLIKQFGDTPEVQTYMEFKRKTLKNEPLSLDERIAYTAAILHLWPDPETKKRLIFSCLIFS